LLWEHHSLRTTICPESSEKLSASFLNNGVSHGTQMSVTAQSDTVICCEVTTALLP